MMLRRPYFAKMAMVAASMAAFAVGGHFVAATAINHQQSKQLEELANIALRACSGTIAANEGLRSDGVVPVAVELVAKDVDGVHLVIGDFDACRIGVPINFGSHF